MAEDVKFIPPQVLGFMVYASVQGKDRPQPISQRYTSRMAAEDFAALARRSGFKDAYVSDVIGMEHKVRAAAKRKPIEPKREKA